MSLSDKLELLADPQEYAGENATWARWGQMLRSSGVITLEMTRLIEEARLCRLAEKGRVRGGVVTRANAYFLVKEVPFSKIPTRMRVTQGDLRRIAVIQDGLGYLCKIEREFLKPVLKGPESLSSAFSVQRTDVRLVDIKKSKEQLEKTAANGALAYLRRGETTSYKVSSDELKGGIPAQRSQVKNRRPFWYSLQGIQSSVKRIVFPEHIDRRYVYTLVDDKDESVVIDKLFLFEAEDPDDVAFIHAGLNSLFGWYQTELRGRSQLGEGVLELKIPDYQGILLADPTTVSDRHREAVLESFARLREPGAAASLDELGSPERLAFDVAYLEACGFNDPDGLVLLLEQELRALAGERVERKLSVADAKISRRKTTNVSATIDAYAARVAAGLPPVPDPREFMDLEAGDESVAIGGEVHGELTVGTDLFDLGSVFAGDTKIAQASSIPAGQIVRAVLIIEPTAQFVRVPGGTRLARTHREWSAALKRWLKEFEIALTRGLAGINDPRIRSSVRDQALKLMHAP